MKSFERLVRDAESRRFSGWDFSYLQGRLVESPTPWDYVAIVTDLLGGATSVVDIGTGGGELLSSLRPLPRNTLATEGYPPNIPVALRRLKPLGVEVIEACSDDNDMLPQRGGLPLRDLSVDLVIDRHEAFIASEVFRVLKPLGRFVTQQAGAAEFPELNSVLGAERRQVQRRWDLAEAVRQVEEAGLEVTDSREASLEARFADVGAVAYYLKAVPWQVPDFGLERYRDRLWELDRMIRERGPFKATFQRFLVQAVKP